MAGELWNAVTKIALEATPGTAETAGDIYAYLTDPTFNRGQPGLTHAFAVGRRDNVLANTLGPQEPSGRVRLPISYDELNEWLQVTVKGAVAPSSTIWTYTPSSTAPDSMTVQWNDGANDWLVSGVRGNTMRISGRANEQTFVDFDLIGQSMVAGTLSGSLTHRVPTFIQPYEVRLFVDAFAGTPGSTQKTLFLVAWDITYSNNIQRKYFADNTNAAGGIALGAITVTARLTVEAIANQADTEFTNWTTPTKRLVGLRFGQDTAYVDVHIPGAWTAFDMGQTDRGTRVYALDLSYIYDPTNAFGFQVKVKNSRAGSFA